MLEAIKLKTFSECVEVIAEFGRSEYQRGYEQQVKESEDEES